MKLEVYVEAYHPTATTDPVALWYRGVIWAFSEHGLSLFASSILALRPLSRYISKGWTSFTSTLYGSSSRSRNSSDFGGQSWLSKDSSRSKKPESAEMNTIGVRNDVSVYSEYNVADSLTHPVYVAEAYNESHESQKRLFEKKRGHFTERGLGLGYVD